MRLRAVDQPKQKTALQMTPMIDIVFQLLVFFILTFKIVASEGDFNIKMPLSHQAQGDPETPELPPIDLRLAAGANGELAAVHLDDREIAPNDLRAEIVTLVGADQGPGSARQTQQIELDCAPNLRYEHVIWAITQVSGEVEDGEIIKLVEKIKFKPPSEQRP